jgi:hypothetical protein
MLTCTSWQPRAMATLSSPSEARASSRRTAAARRLQLRAMHPHPPETRFNGEFTRHAYPAAWGVFALGYLLSATAESQQMRAMPLTCASPMTNQQDCPRPPT